MMDDDDDRADRVVIGPALIAGVGLLSLLAIVAAAIGAAAVIFKHLFGG